MDASGRGDEFAQARLRMMVVAGGLVTGPLMLGVVAMLMSVPRAESGKLGLLVPASAILAAAAAVIAPAVQRRLLSASPAGEPQHVDLVLGRITTAVVVPFGIAEASAILGFVLYVLGGGLLLLAGFVALSLAADAMCFPTPARFDAWLAQCLGSSPDAERYPL